MRLRVTQYGIIDDDSGEYVAWIAERKLTFVDGLVEPLNKWLADVCREHPFNPEIDTNRGSPAGG